MRTMRRYGQVTILSGQSLSDAYDVGEFETLTGIIVPAWTSASLTLAGGLYDGRTPAYTYGGPNSATEFRDSLTYTPVFDEGADAEFTVTAATGGIYIAVDGAKLAGVQFLKVRSGTSAAPVVQAADRVITLVSTCS